MQVGQTRLYDVIPVFYLYGSLHYFLGALHQIKQKVPDGDFKVENSYSLEKYSRHLPLGIIGVLGKTG